MKNMKRMILQLVGGTFLFFLYNRSHAANWQSEYWIAYRTDAQNGDGSLGNPYNGNGADNFDSNLSSIIANSVIHILPGSYQTRGSKWLSVATKGFAFHNGWKIQGSGVDNTIIQLIDANADTASNMVRGPVTAK